MKKPQEKKEFKIGIQRVRELSCFVNEAIGRSCAQAEVNMQTLLYFDVDTNALVFQIAVTFSNQEKQAFAAIETSNHFILENMVDYQNTDDPNKLDLPEDILVLVFSISYSHSRALLSRHLNGTAIEHFILPIINPGEVLKQLNIAMTKMGGQQ